MPILEEKQVWGTNDQTRTAYLDTTDVARMTLASLRCVFSGFAPVSGFLALSYLDTTDVACVTVASLRCVIQGSVQAFCVCPYTLILRHHVTAACSMHAQHDSKHPPEDQQTPSWTCRVLDRRS